MRGPGLARLSEHPGALTVGTDPDEWWHGHETRAVWHAGRSSGLRDAGIPGERPHYKPDYYGAFLLDPDGNSVEVVNHNRAAADV